MAKRQDGNRMDGKAGEQPEALAAFGKAARSGGVTPPKSLYADAETKPVSTDPKKKADAATRVLREGVLHDDEGAAKAVRALPDRAMKSKG